MKTNTVEYYDWMAEVKPVLLDNLNQLLIADGIEPLKQLHGGFFKDNEWVSSSSSNDYRNYWHAYIEMWGDGLRNDNYQTQHFPDPADNEGWEYCINHLREWASYGGSKHADPNWTDNLVKAMRKVVTDHFKVDEVWGDCHVVFWWSW